MGVLVMMAVSYVGGADLHQLSWDAAHPILARGLLEGRLVLCSPCTTLIVINSWWLWRLVWRMLGKAFFVSAGYVAADLLSDLLVIDSFSLAGSRSTSLINLVCFALLMLMLFLLPVVTFLAPGNCFVGMS